MAALPSLPGNKQTRANFRMRIGVCVEGECGYMYVSDSPREAMKLRQAKVAFIARKASNFL